MGTWNKIESGLAPTDNKIEFDTESLGKFALKVSEGRLPSGFQEVEYIESSSTQYIDTAYKTSSTATSMEIICNIYGVVGGYNLLGWYTQGVNCCVYGLGNSQFRYDVWYNGSHYHGNYSAGDRLGFDITATASGINNKFYVNNTLNYSENFTNRTLLNLRTNNRTFYLFTINHSLTGTESLIPTKLYNASFYEDTILVRDFVPCYCTESVTAYKGSTQTTATSGTAGLYDLVDNKFYINSGTGSFIVGPDVN